MLVCIICQNNLQLYIPLRRHTENKVNMTIDYSINKNCRSLLATGYWLSPIGGYYNVLERTMCLVTVVICPAVVYPVAGQLVGDAQRGLDTGELIARVVVLHLTDLCPHGPEALGTD